MTRSTLPAHHIYTCRKCGDNWLEENEGIGTKRGVVERARCMSCGSFNINRSSSLPLPLAHELLRRNMIYSTKNVAKLVENGSADRWNKHNVSTINLFAEQIALLSNIYDVILIDNQNV